MSDLTSMWFQPWSVPVRRPAFVGGEYHFYVMPQRYYTPPNYLPCEGAMSNADLATGAFMGTNTVAAEGLMP